MCGIAGIVQTDGRPVDPTRVKRLVASMRNRGPDGAGFHIEGSVGLGMRRLSILDLEHGTQPFSTPDGRIIAFLNGELYNFRDLRQELEREGVHFKTQCDAEIIPFGYRRWGAEGLAQRLDGMFGISIYDRSANTLCLMRDRYGEKPLFYFEGSGVFAFASQFTSLIQIPEIDLEVDPTALRQYLALHFVTGPRTILESVRRVPPGHQLEVDLSGAKPTTLKRWTESAPRTRRNRQDYASAVEETREQLSRAVQTRLIADVPVGVFLSGGVDSSAIAAAVAQQGVQPQTFSIGFEDASLDESPFARSVASHVGSNHHHFDFNLDACLEVLDDAMESLDEPLGDPACLPVLLLSREARRHVKVVLSGEGADEFFAGYAYYPKPPYPLERPPRLASSFFKRWRGKRTRAVSTEGPFENFLRSDNTTPSGFPLLTSHANRDDFVRKAATDEDAWLSELNHRLEQEPCPLRRAQRADIETWLADDLLQKFDHMSMAASLEGRAPFLEPQLAATGLEAPAEWKVTADGNKRLLRDAVAPWLPHDVLHRPKQGFVLPMQDWLVGPLRDRLLDGLAREEDDGLNSQTLRALALTDLDSGAERARLLYAVLAYREWFAAVREKRTLANRLVSLDESSGQ